MTQKIKIKIRFQDGEKFAPKGVPGVLNNTKNINQKWN